MNKKVKFLDEQKINPLLKSENLFNVSLDEFSKYSFKETSLNVILKTINMNKGSFYYRFYDKVDLYLCMLHKIGLDKLEFFQNRTLKSDITGDFFVQIHAITLLSVEYAKHEKRYFNFWRKYLAEDESIKLAVLDTFPDFGKDYIKDLINNAYKNNNFSKFYSKDFIYNVVQIYLNNIDKLIDTNFEDEEILLSLNQLINFLKKGLSN